MAKNVKINKIYLFLLVLSIAIVLFFESLVCPFSCQHELFFRNGNDFFADFFNVAVLASEKNIYQGDKAFVGQKGYLSRQDRAYPPLAYLPFLALHCAVSNSSSANPLIRIACYA